MRQLREELFAGSGHYRRILEEAEFNPFRFRGGKDLPALPTSDVPTLVTVEPTSLCLKPSPRAMKELWSFGRKFALVFTGARAASLLERAYHPVLATEEQGLAVTWTATDLELAGEQGARVLDLCGVQAEDQVALDLEEAPSFGRLLFERGAQRCEVSLDADPSGATHLITSADRADALIAGRAEPLELLMILGPLAAEQRAQLAGRAQRLAQIWTSGPARTAALAGPIRAGEPFGGHVFFPDLVAAELVDPSSGEPSAGELLLTPLGSHGTALLRLRTGHRATDLDWTPCPRTGLRLPRVQQLEPLA